MEHMPISWGGLGVNVGTYGIHGVYGYHCRTLGLTEVAEQMGDSQTRLPKNCIPEKSLQACVGICFQSNTYI